MIIEYIISTGQTQKLPSEVQESKYPKGTIGILANKILLDFQKSKELTCSHLGSNSRRFLIND